MKRTASNLVQACETSGDAFLQLCRMLSAQGVKLSEASPHLGQLTTELQDLLKLTETKATFSKTLHGLQAATRAGVAGDYFPVGTVISDTWRDTKRGCYLPSALDCCRLPYGAADGRQRACFGSYSAA